jgi:hypothetical protein
MRNQILSLLLLPLLLAGNVHAEDNWSGNVNLLLGSKALDENDWFAYQQGEVGILFDFGRSNWPVNIVIDMLSSSGDFDGFAYYPPVGVYHVDEKVSTRELNLGVRHYFDASTSMRPYFGGGLAMVHLDTDWRIDSGAWQHDEGKGGGIWLDGGILWGFDHFNLGFDMRVSLAEVEMDLGNYEGGGGHFGLVLGYNW